MQLAGIMSRRWPVQDAKSRISELLDTALAEGPQIVTKDGVKTVVIVPFEQWSRRERRARPDLKDLLLAPEERTEHLTPPRRKHRHTTPLAAKKHYVYP